MIKSSSLIIIFIILVAWLVYLFPGQAISPGNLSEEHSHLNENCSSCHDTFQGPSTKKCVECHDPNKIVTKDSNHLRNDFPEQTPPFHSLLESNSCLSCHTEHQGRFSVSQTLQFSHQALGLENTDNCIDCHQQPKNLIHPKTDQNCARCHSASNWDSTKINHSTYFSFDRDHQTDCVTCHPGSNYQEYTCYNCHEHSEQKITRKHIKEGVRDFSDCVECHRSGDEHDIRKTRIMGGTNEKTRDEYIRESFIESEYRSEHERKSKNRSDDHEKDNKRIRKKREH